MKKIISAALSLICLWSVMGQGLRAQDRAVPVFVAGQDGYQRFRIPAIIRLPNGKLLAFAEGRVGGMADFGNIDIVMKHSDDNGRTWSASKVVADNGSLQAGNPAPVVDLSDRRYPSGRVFLFYNTGDVPESSIRRGEGKREIWYRTSPDQGESWSAPVNITGEVKRSGWRSYANTPGHAMQFGWGPYKGRIYVAVNHSSGDPAPHFEDYRANGFFTDDHGGTFRLSEDVPFPGGNEATAAQFSDRGLMMNIRNQTGTPRSRIVALSEDGGVHWDSVYCDPSLPDPVCQGSLLTLKRRGARSILAFCNNRDTLSRRNLTVRISSDGGMHWLKAYPITTPETETGYSDLVRLGNRRLGILYETNNYHQIAFATCRW